MASRSARTDSAGSGSIPAPTGGSALARFRHIGRSGIPLRAAGLSATQVDRVGEVVDHLSLFACMGGRSPSATDRFARPSVSLLTAEKRTLTVWIQNLRTLAKPDSLWSVPVPLGAPHLLFFMLARVTVCTKGDEIAIILAPHSFIGQVVNLMAGPLKQFPVQLRRMGVGEINVACKSFGKFDVSLGTNLQLGVSEGEYNREERTLHPDRTARYMLL